jgi:hypothetical protein
MKVRSRVLLVVLALVFWSSAVGASPILAVVATSGGYTDNAYGGIRWPEMTAELNAAFGGASNVTVLASASGLLTYDAVWVDQRLGPTLTPSELAELSAFAASGRRMVMIGENNSWDNWNLQILGLVGGGYIGACGWDVATPAITHLLTTGVSSVALACGSYAIGGTPVFTSNFATLWGSGLNVLTILDSNMMESQYRTNDNAQFFDNVSTWLAGGGGTTVPDPGSTLLLLGMGLVGLRAWRKRQ